MALLERDTDIAALEAALSGIRDGPGRVVLVSGEAGIGKTSLIAEFTRRSGDHAEFLLGHCDPLITPNALGPLHDIAGQAGGDLRHALDGGAPRAQLFSAVLARLQRRTRPTVLVLEDLHWADEATLDLVSYLGRRIAGTAALLVLTFRDDELGNDHPLRRVLGALAGSRETLRIQPSPLTLAAVTRLAGDDGRDAGALHRATNGNPFFVSEILADRGSTVPQTVRDAVLARCARLAPESRALLEQLAVLGARIERRLLLRLEGADGERFDSCLASGILRQAGDAIVFRHELARVAVLEAMNPLRRRACARIALEIVARENGRDGSALAQLAQHAEEAGDVDATIAWSMKAGSTAAAVGAHREAAAQFRRAVRASAGRPPAERALHLEALARSSHLLDDLDEAIAAYRDVAALHREAGNHLKEGAALAELAWPLVRAAENAAAEDACRQAIEILERLPPSRELANALRVKAHLRMLDRDRAEAERWGERAIRLARDLDDDRILAEAEMVVGSARLVSGDDSGRAALERCFAIARDRGFDSLVALAHLNVGSSYGEQFRLAEAERELETGLAFARNRDLDHSTHYMEAWLALVRLYQGRWSEAADIAAGVLAEPRCAAISRIMALVALGRVRTRRGDPGARDALDDALALARRTRTLQRLAPVHAARAEHFSLQGDRAAALAEAGAVYELALHHRHRWHAGEMTYWRHQGGEAPAMPDWAAEPYRLQVAGAWHEAAEAWARLGCPYEQARALADGDLDAQVAALEILVKLGAGPLAAQLRQRVRQSGVRVLPRGPRAATRAHRFGLTDRQAHVLEALVEGLSNKEIAARHGLSPKTIDHHVSAVLEKLDVPTRQEAVRLVRRMEPQDPT